MGSCCNDIWQWEGGWCNCCIGVFWSRNKNRVNAQSWFPNMKLASTLTFKWSCGFTWLTGTANILWDRGAVTCFSEASAALVPFLPPLNWLYLWCGFSGYCTSWKVATFIIAFYTQSFWLFVPSQGGISVEKLLGTPKVISCSWTTFFFFFKCSNWATESFTFHETCSEVNSLWRSLGLIWRGVSHRDRLCLFQLVLYNWYHQTNRAEG